MKRFIITAIAAACLAGSVQAQLAITEAMPSASTNLGPSEVTPGPDFWELTNFGTNAVDLSGYIFNDADATRGGDANSSTLSGTIINAGESIILVQAGTLVATRDDFINWWGAAGLPANLQVLFYTGNGLSSGGDSLVLWAPDATSDLDYLHRVDFGEASRGHSFTYHATNGVFGAVSSNGVAGAFKAATADDEASPGFTTGTVALKFTRQPAPAAQNVPAGQDATFTAAATGLPHPRFQWRFKGTNLDGAISSVLTITNAQLTNSGAYSVVINNGVESLISSNAMLTVTTDPVPPVFVTTFTNAEAFIGQMVQFAAQVNGSPTPSLQWKSNGVAILGETGNQLTLFNVQTNDSASYSLVATSSAGSNSIAAQLTVGEKPKLMITEVHATGSTGHQDWWEVTSFDTRNFNLKGWRWDDSSHSLAPNNAYVFTNDIIIHPGESVVIVENFSSAQFKTWWGTNLPEGLQIATYVGNGLGLSSGSDEVNLWNAVTLPGNELTDRIAAVTFASSFVGVSFIYDPENPPIAGILGVFSTNAFNSTAANGVFAAAQGGDQGSPGYVVAPVRASTAITNGNSLVLTWSSAINRSYIAQYKADLSATNWNVLSLITATSTNGLAEDSLSSTQRFYRVGAIVPFVSEQP